MTANLPPPNMIVSAGSRAEPNDRIEGWKSIGAYFGRDRTTAIRWARDRSMPVHRIPGGKISTTFALRHELEAWASGVAGTDLAESKPVPQEAAPAQLAQAPTARLRFVLRWLSAGALLLAAATFVPDFVAADMATPKSSVAALPRDAAVSERYLAARDLTATRNAQSLERAISMLRDVNRRAPEFAPGYSALAEALILSREFGVRSDENAFPAASFAARTALRLDPSLAEGYRMKAFIAYWWDQDLASARGAFEESIARNPSDAMANFWYGNILIDSGSFDSGLRKLNIARAMRPGSVAILTDLAWGQWSAGDTVTAERTLAAIIADYPEFAVAHDCIGEIRLAEGDYAGYAAAMATVSALRQDDAMAARARELQSALAGGERAANAVVMRHALRDVAEDPRKTYLRPVFIASVAGDRAQTLSLLRRAAQRNEKWGEAGIVGRIKARWVNDAQITQMIAARQSFVNSATSHSVNSERPRQPSA